MLMAFILIIAFHILNMRGIQMMAPPNSIFECASNLHELYMGKHSYELQKGYNKNIQPDKNTSVYISVFVNRVSAVDENKEEITLDVFLQVYWEDKRLKTLDNESFVELPWEHRHLIWMPDLYIWQLRDMRILSVFQEMTSMRLYSNGTMRVSIGATIIIKCDMDFVLYPLDVQKCVVDFSSYRYTAQEVTFEWRQETPLWFSSDGTNEFRLPKYVVTFTTDPQNHIITYGEGNHSAARLHITLSRELRSYLLETYLPSSLFVIMSWGGFCVLPEIVPGRMVLLVTTLLSLVTMFDTVRNNSPNALELKCVEVWLISCTIFVFLALLEYFVVLFGIRYDKYWRKRPMKPPTITGANHNPQTVIPASSAPSVFTARISPSEDDAHKQQLAIQTIQRDPPTLESEESCEEPIEGTWNQIKHTIEKTILFCGSQRGTLDKISLMLFPLSFMLFTAIYWTTYINEAHKNISKPF